MDKRFEQNVEANAAVRRNSSPFIASDESTGRGDVGRVHSKGVIYDSTNLAATISLTCFPSSTDGPKCPLVKTLLLWKIM